MTEADFLSTVTKDGKEYKIVEQHRVSDGGYNITVKAYERFAFSGAKEYREVPLERAGIADGEGTSPVKLFQEWKVPEANNIDHYSPLGISIYANATDTLRQIDEAFDYLATELETSRRKIIIQRSMLTGYFDTAKDKTVPYYDKNEKVYVAFDAADKESMAPVAIDFELRIDAIKQTLNTLFSILSKQCGNVRGLSFIRWAEHEDRNRGNKRELKDVPDKTEHRGKPNVNACSFPFRTQGNRKRLQRTYNEHGILDTLERLNHRGQGQ